MSRANSNVDVFRLINLMTGPEWTDPETGEVSRCWPFTGKTNSENRPYIQVDGKKKLAYRVVYELVTGEQLGDRLYRHKCDNEICCNPKHGIPGDHQENMNDMKGRQRHGMTHHAVRHIKKLIAFGISDADIAERFGCGKTTVYDIRVGNTFAHVKEEEEDNE